MSLAGRIGEVTRNALMLMVLLSSLVLGGGQGALGDTLVQLLAFALLGVVLLAWVQGSAQRPPALAWWVLLPLALPLLQLLPLPPGIWLIPDARQEIAGQLAIAGVEPLTRWSLDPTATERALYWLAPAYAMFFATLQARQRQRLLLVALFLVVACVGVVLGVAQQHEGPHSDLRLHPLNNIHYAVGFYANRNHFAGQLAAALPFALMGALLAWQAWRRGAAVAAMGLVVALGSIVLLLLGIGLAGSRAGLGLGVLMILLALPAAWATGRHPGRRRYRFAIVAGLALALLLFAGAFGSLGRFESGSLKDERWEYAEVAGRAAAAHAPLGAGLGTFRQSYQAFEGDKAGGTIINHAHSDLVEWWLDGGWLTPLLALPLVGLFGLAGWRVWRPDPARWSSTSLLLARAAWIALLGILLHVFVDYALRTTAHLALAGLLAGLMLPAREGRAGQAAESAPADGVG